MNINENLDESSNLLQDETEIDAQNMIPRQPPIIIKGGSNLSESGAEVEISGNSEEDGE